MRKIIMSSVFLVILILGSSQVVAANAQESNFILTLNPGAISSDSQNPISPANITVPTGANVTWINKDSSPHMIVSGIPEEGPDNVFYGDFFTTDENYTVTVDNPGLYPYYDKAWNHIRGQITVEDESFSSELDSSANNSSVAGIDGNFVLDSTATAVNDYVRSEFRPSDEGTFSFPSSSSSLSSSPFADNGTGQSSFSQSNGAFSSGDINNQTSFPSSSLSSSGSDQTLMGLFEQVGPLLGLIMNGSNSSPLSSLSQSNETFGESLMDLANVSTSEFEGAQSVDGNTSSLLNETVTFQNGSVSSSDEERAKVQEELINAIKKAYSIGFEIPKTPEFESDEGTVFVKVNVINPSDKKANASDFPIQYDYQNEFGSVGVGQEYANDAGVFINISPGSYAITSPTHEALGSFLNSYLSSYSKGCSGQLSSMEIKDCTITKTYANVTNNNSTSQ